MDLIIPEMGRYEATRAVRRHFKYTDIPVVAVREKVMKDNREKSLGVGAPEYLTNLVDITRITRIIRGYLEQWNMRA